MERLTVIAPAGMICPKEGGTGMIDDRTPVPVPNNRYYRRLLKEKSLFTTAPQKAKTAKPEPDRTPGAPAAASTSKRGKEGKA